MTSQLKAVNTKGRMIPPGEMLSDRFEVREQIGKGPFGEVYRAEDTLIDASVAVKVFDPAIIEDPRDQEAFLNATRRARKMTQKNVVRIHDSGVHDDHPWVSMQALEGLSLRKILDMRRAKGEHFELAELEPIVTQVTLALQHVNREFPVGDLKPENILLMPETLKVTDIFLYAAVPHDIFAERLEDSRYVAPELHTPSDSADGRVDVYSLGIIIGEMLFGPEYTPGSAPDGQQNRSIDALCKKATAFDPAERYESVEALSEDFATLVDTGALLQQESTHDLPELGRESSVPTGLGNETSVPPPAPAANATDAASAPEPDPLAEETPMDIGEPPEEDIETREYNRDEDSPQELGDLLKTNEVRREELPPPPERREDADREPTKTAVKPKPKDRKSSGESQSTPPHLIIGGLVVIIALIGGAVWWASDTDEEEVVTIADNTNAASAETTPDEDETAKADEDAAEEDKPTTEQTTAAVTEAQSGLGEAKKAATASMEEASADAGSADAGQEDATTLAAASETGDQESAGSSGGSKSSGSSSDSSGAASRSGSGSKAPDKEKPAAKGTDCPGGMALVKKDSGNYCIDRYEYPGGGSTPRTNVSWFKAKQLCEAKGKRLCKLNEWKRACGSKYPYGSKWDPNKCNTVDVDGFERSLAATGKNKACRSWPGLYDMVGNAHEWTQEQRIAGGGFDSGEDVATCRYSSPKAAGSSAPNIGFRCCANPQ
jgi:serine/threonine protein kinase